MKKFLIVNKFNSAPDISRLATGLSILCFLLSAFPGHAQTNPPASTNKPPRATVPAPVPPAAQPVKPTKVRVEEIVQDMGVMKCRTSQGIYLIAQMPPDTRTRLVGIAKAENEVKRLTTKINATSAKTIGTANQIATARKSLADLKQTAADYTTINIVETAQVYAGQKVWRAIGIAQGESNGRR